MIQAGWKPEVLLDISWCAMMDVLTAWDLGWGMR
jgi:hypothetical protein